MPVSIVVGGQFGSEGKGKVALEIARRSTAPVTMVRVGGPNSGHTSYDRAGRKFALRQMSSGCVDMEADVVFPSGSYLDIDVLMREIDELDYPKEKIHVSRFARIVTAEHRAWEQQAGIGKAIGSTVSGTGAAVLASLARGARNFSLQNVMAESIDILRPFICDSTNLLRGQLDAGRRVIVEGTQGFGLSLLESGFWPKVTARSTTAAAALAEAGLAPTDVDDVTMVIRAHPIRVAGDSGPLSNETTWEDIAHRAGRTDDITETTTVTKRIRRVGQFNADLVRRALLVNNPSRLVINHLDYIGTAGSEVVDAFLAQVELGIDRQVDWIGFSPAGIIERDDWMAKRPAP